MASAEDQLDIAIIGAGIAGLAAGISLRRAGHAVTIYEQSKFKIEVGAAINMPPQAGRILREWGLAGLNPTAVNPYADRAHGKHLHGTRQYDAGTAKVLSDSSFLGDEEVYGAPFVSYHRADLHSGLTELALEAGIRIELGRTVLDVDCKATTLFLLEEDGKRQCVCKDSIVLADGVNTTLVEQVTGQNIPLLETGRSAYRTLVPTSKLLADPATSLLFQNNGEHYMRSSTNPKTSVFIIAYPCRGGELMSIAIFHPTRPAEKNEQDWNSPASIEDALSVLEGFHPAFKAMVRCADTMRVYPITHRDPLPTSVNNKTIMIGDAAHPMLPNLAGGGSTALEDAAALEVLLAGVTKSEDEKIRGRLKLWNALRLPRDAVTQVLGKSLGKPKMASEYAEEAKTFYAGTLPDVTLPGWTKRTKDLVCSYDVFEETTKALEWAERRGYEGDLMLDLQREGVVKHFGR